MRRTGVFVFGLILFTALLVIILSDNELGKYDSFEEALQKGIPYQVKRVIHTQEVDGITVVMYKTEPDKDKLPLANYDALAVAFLEGSDEDGWENIGPNGWTHYENNNLTLYTEGVHDHDQQGNVKHEFYVAFGEINNPKITKIETNTFKPVPIIETDYGRYYFIVGRPPFIRGLNDQGDVIEQQGG